jgi:NTP pyrophosphatase (non-canonical NTP hydrolase)
MKTLNELRDEIHKNAVKHGFYEDESCAVKIVTAEGTEGMEEALKHAFFAQKIALIHSELSEALEADRKGGRPDMERFERLESVPVNPSANPGHVYVFDFNLCIKNTVEDELTDVIIRTLDLCGYLGIDIEKHVELKMKYNELREYKHGKNY